MQHIGRSYIDTNAALASVNFL